VGDQGHDGRDQGRRHPAGHAAGDGRQAEAERERRAKVINAEGEFQASERLFDAAQIMSANPTALQLRYLQTLLEVGTTRTRRCPPPFPSTSFTPLMQNGQDGADRGRRAARRREAREHERELDGREGARARRRQRARARGGRPQRTTFPCRSTTTTSPAGDLPAGEHEE
jgi:hypothetical protein